MATAKQIEANRRNAQKSTGPRTEEGKSRSRWNSLRHGLAAVHEVLPHEDPSVYHEMRAELIHSWQPANTQELMLVDDIAQGWWAMERARRFENNMFELQVNSIRRTTGTPRQPNMDDDGAIAISFGEPDAEKDYELLLRYAARAESRYHRAIDQLNRVQNSRFRRTERQERLEMQREKLASSRKKQPVFVPASETSLYDEPEASAAPVETAPPQPRRYNDPAPKQSGSETLGLSPVQHTRHNLPNRDSGRTHNVSPENAAGVPSPAA